MRLADKIMYLRNTNKISQKDFAKALGVSRQTAYKWEADLSVPEIDKIKTISKFFDVSYDDLVDDTKSVTELQKSTVNTEEKEEILPSIVQNSNIKPKSNKKLILFSIITSILFIVIVTALIVILLPNNFDNTSSTCCETPVYKVNKVIKEATCEESGISEIICTKCGQIKERNEQQKNHYYENNICLFCGLVNTTTGVEYAIDENSKTAYVKKVRNLNGYDVIIAEEYNGYKVTKIGSRAFAYSSVKLIKIPDTVEIIEEFAFYRCVNLNNITFGKSVISIGESAFADCGNFEQIIFPDSLFKISSKAFENTSINKIELGKNINLIDKNAFNNCKVNYFIFKSNGKWSLTCETNTTQTIEVLPYINESVNLKTYSNYTWTKQE